MTDNPQVLWLVVAAGLSTDRIECFPLATMPRSQTPMQWWLLGLASDEDILAILTFSWLCKEAPSSVRGSLRLGLPDHPHLLFVSVAHVSGRRCHIHMDCGGKENITWIAIITETCHPDGI